MIRFFVLVLNLFVKKEICVQCLQPIVLQNSPVVCLCANARKTCSIYDVDLVTSLHFQIGRLWPKIITYKRKIELNQSDDSNDIPFNIAYRDMLTRIDLNRNFMSLILHLDGISLCKSTKHTLWLLSGVIVELPPELRYRRENMILLSVYVGQSEPTTRTWLNSCVANLLRLKTNGKFFFFTDETIFIQDAHIQSTDFYRCNNSIQ